MKKMGALDWVKNTGGVLSWKEKTKIVAQGVFSTLRLKKRILGHNIQNLDIDEILPPDSPIAKEALFICEEASEKYLFYHCLRSYYWARLLSDPSLKFDDEAVFVSFMLHDLGLCEQNRIWNQGQYCFTIVGAKKAEELACKHDWSDKRAKLAANAITLHLNVTIDSLHGREAQMVRLGSGADVAGLGLDNVRPDQFEKVIHKYPRNNFKELLLRDLKIELQENPCCRAAFLQRNLGFRKLIRNSVFVE